MENSAEHQTVLDTDHLHLGDVYAKALLATGQKSGNTDQLLDEIDSFSTAVDGLPALRRTLESPRVGFDEKEKLIQKICGKASNEFNNFVKVLTRQGRFNCLPAIRAAASRMHNEMTGRVEATLTTAEEVSEEVKQDVVKKLKAALGKDIVLRTRTDPGIIAGVLIRVGDTVYDGSMANELQRVRKAALQRANQEIRESFDRFSVDA